MKKDIHVPEVTDIEVAIVYEYNEIYKTDDWNVYIINNKDTAVEMMVIVSQGFSETKTTSVLRKKLNKLPANSFAKIELLKLSIFNQNYSSSITVFKLLFSKEIHCVKKHFSSKKTQLKKVPCM